MTNDFLTWRTYRDRSQAPVPVVRAQGETQTDTSDDRHAHLHFDYVPREAKESAQDDRLVPVQPFTSARGLFTGRRGGEGDHLAASVLREEPVLLELKTPRLYFYDTFGFLPNNSDGFTSSGDSDGIGGGFQLFPINPIDVPQFGIIEKADYTTHVLAKPVWDGGYGIYNVSDGHVGFGAGNSRTYIRAHPDGDLLNTPYMQPRVEFYDGEPFLVTPTAIHSQPGGRTETFRAKAIEDGVFQIPPGYPGDSLVPYKIKVNGSALQKGYYQYDPYHGTLLIRDSGTEPVPQESAVTVEIDTRTRFAVPLSEHDVEHTPITRTPSGDQFGLKDGDVQGHVIVGRQPIYVDTRRVAPATSGDAADTHRVGRAHYDGDPISHQHLWIIETDAPPERVKRAVEMSMPAGTLYRIVPKNGPAQ